ncbi:urea ABC transporter permease subunit UrtC [Roseibacillus ishigakijimensis]|uniref:Urea ABC transporter permease subunit UrtC n=1 Tax=Roseibacillus ishigakijimensis TaxID=454146 RepID=A0A934RQ64_9BACT|nr:urea ABC transporter permease subunit UrtC [Roseibacillus ishigakijimensis]MBK1833064.1 urea ABC transporter permease subunit UrtC [Roseibacillus ishigakijimensis]
MNASSPFSNLARPFNNRGEWITFALLAVFIAAFPILNGMGVLSSFQLGVWGKYLCYAVLAMSLNMLWGYTGLLCLGQCLFFALGGYAFGMYLMLMIGELGSYQSTLPDFMVFLGYKELPLHWKPFYNPWFAIFAAMVVPGLVAFIFGTLAFRSRIKGVYFSILTQALTYAATLMFFRNDFTFGGNNGFTDFKFIFGADIRDDSTTRALFIASGVLLLAVYWGLSWLLKTKFGQVQRAIRDSENRVRFSGYSSTHYKVFIFVLSAIIAGLAGALYVPQAGIINPEEMKPSKGLDIVVWVAVGGRGTKFGPVIGAILVSLLKSWSTRAFPEYWLIILGLLFVVVVLFMPDGIVGLYHKVVGYVKSYRAAHSDSKTLVENN